MSVELLQIFSLVAYIVAAVFFLLGIALFFLLDVPKLYGDVSGRTARKAIEKIRKQNETTGDKAYKPSSVNASRGKLTDRITMSGRLESQTAGLPVSVGTEKFSTSTLAPQSNETTVLSSTTDETTLLIEKYPEKADETTVLRNEETVVDTSVIGSVFSVDVEMSFTGSSEIIE